MEVFRSNRNNFSAHLPELVLIKASAAGERGSRWLESLDQRVKDLQHQWRLQIVDVLPGGTESLTLHVVDEKGVEAVLKIGLYTKNITRESCVLQLAQGHGYAKMLASNLTSNAILIEKLGPSLSASGASIDEHIFQICTTLKEAWMKIDPAIAQGQFKNGAEKAHELAQIAKEKWKNLNQPCSRETIDKLCAFALERINAFDPQNSLLLHGDAHGRNALYSCTSGCRFIDPKGLFAEKAADLAYLMRDWSWPINENTALLLRQRCVHIATLCNADVHATWQWGFIERVTIGLLLIEFGKKDKGYELLKVADILIYQGF